MGRYIHYSREHGRALVKLAREDPNFLESLRESGCDRAYNYVTAALLNDEIKAWCKAEGITEWRIMMQRLEAEHPQWYEHLQNHNGSAGVMMICLESRKPL